MLNRRSFVAQSALGFAAACAPRGALQTSAGPALGLPAFYEDLEQRTFRFFWERANPVNGMVPDRWPSPSFASIAAIGFALTAYAIGAHRGWITRTEARDRTLTTLRTLSALPQGDAREGTAGHRGFFYHFLDMKTGLRFQKTELSSVDTALLFMGVLFAVQWYDAEEPAEAEIRRIGTALVDRAEWPWMQQPGGTVSMGWYPEGSFITKGWNGYNEAGFLYILALGSGGNPLGDGAWDAWCRTYPDHWRGSGDQRHLAFGPLFGHQYGPMWIDFRGIRDAAMREAGFDYFENSRRATAANRIYCLANPMNWAGYSADLWGLTACDGPANTRREYQGDERFFFSYAARGPLGQPDERDDGTIAPTAALGSLAFAPEICIPAANALYNVPGLMGQYGFRDSFNPSFRFTDVALTHGTVDPANGWVASDWLGIDQGPILGAAANYRDDFVWRTMRASPVIRRGLERAGFTGGWLRG